MIKLNNTNLILSIMIIFVSGYGATGEKYVDWNKNGSLDDYENPELSIEERVNDLVSRMTLEEKVSQMGHNAPAIERLGISKYNWWNECVHGVVAHNYKTTVFPQAIGLASTWNTELINSIASAISDEARVLANIEKNQRYLTFWSPVINMGRDPRWGRTQEGYGEDPYLVSRLAVEFVKGLQGDHPKYLKLVSTPKHFAVNNEEWRRHSGSAEVDERSLREYYLAPFKACVMEGKAYSVMSAYNAVNGVPCSCNEKLLSDILRKEWGFAGYVVSDCGAIRDIYENHHFVSTPEEASALSVKAGTDLNCLRTYQQHLVNAVERGLIEEDDIDIAILRLFDVRFRLGMFDPPELVPYTRISPDVVNSKKHGNLALRAARESIVLLKNEINLLPLDKNLKSIAVIGPDADIAQFGNYSGKALKAISPLAGIKNRVSDKTEVYFASGCLQKRGALPTIEAEYLIPVDGKRGGHGLQGEYFNNMTLSGNPVFTRIDKKIDFNWGGGSPDERINENHFSIRWSGRLKAPASQKYKLSLTTDDGVRFYINDKLLIEEWHMRGPTTNIIAIELEAGKTYDLKIEYYEQSGGASAQFGWEPLSRDPLAEAIETAKKSDVAVLVVGTDLSIENEGNDRESLDIPDDQNELVKKVLEVNPRTIVVLINGSPLSINWMDKNVPAIIEAWFPGQAGGYAIADVIFGLYNPSGKLPITFCKSIDQLSPFDDYDITNHRTYMYLKEEPLYPFGYGLSYTQFEYSEIRLSRSKYAPEDTVEVSCIIQNSGRYDGEEVVQLYISDIESPLPMPSKQLKGFKRIFLKHGEQRTVKFKIPIFSGLSYYDTCHAGFRVEPGEFEMQIGSSSKDIRLRETFSVH